MLIVSVTWIATVGVFAAFIALVLASVHVPASRHLSSADRTCEDDLTQTPCSTLHRVKNGWVIYGSGMGHDMNIGSTSRAQLEAPQGRYARQEKG